MTTQLQLIIIIIIIIINVWIATHCCVKNFGQERCYLLQSCFLWRYHIAVPGTLHYKQTVRTAYWEVTFSVFQHGGQWTILQQHLHPDFYRLAYPIGAGYSVSEGRLPHCCVIQQRRTTQRYHCLEKSLPSSRLSFLPAISLMTSRRRCKWIGYPVMVVIHIELVTLHVS